MSREEIIDKFKELIEKNGKNSRLDVTDAGTEVVSIEYKKSVNDIIFNFDKEINNFCLLGKFTTEELCNMYARFTVNY